MILATITTSTGINSVRESKFTKFKTQMEIMQAQVDYLNEKYKNELEQANKEGTEFTELGETVDLNNQNMKDSFIGAGITEENEQKKYRYYNKTTLEKLDVSDIEIEFLVNLKERKVIAINGYQYDNKNYYTLQQINGTSTTEPFTRIKNVTVDNTKYEKIEEGYKITLENVQCSEYVGKYDVKYREENSTNYKTAGKGITETNYSFIVYKTGKYYIQIVDAAGQTTEQEIELKIQD